MKNKIHLTSLFNEAHDKTYHPLFNEAHDNTHLFNKASATSLIRQVSWQTRSYNQGVVKENKNKTRLILI